VLHGQGMRPLGHLLQVGLCRRRQERQKAEGVDPWRGKDPLDVRRRRLCQHFGHRVFFQHQYSVVKAHGLASPLPYLSQQSDKHR